MTRISSSPVRATSRDWWAVAVLTLPALLASMDLSILFMAAPWISAELSPTASQHLWMMDIYGFVMAGFLITMGSLGDRIGRRRMLLIGAAAFGAASLLAAFSTSAEMLIAARALLGLGGATLAPSTLSLIRSMFRDPDQRRTAIGIWTAAFTGGFAVGPIIGGLLLERFHWGAVFLINVPIMVLLLIAAPLMIRESRDPNPGRLDLLGAVFSLAAVLPTIYGIKRIVADGVDAVGLLGLAVGAVFAALFAIRQLKAPTPMIDVRLFRHAAFSASIAANMTVVFATAGMGLMAVTFIQAVLGYSPFDAAVWMLPAVAGSVLGVTAASTLGGRIRPAVMIAVGLAVSAGGFAWVSRIGPDDHIRWLILGYALLTVGVGITATVATSLVLATAPPEKAGAASAVSETSAEFGGALGIAILGTIAAGIYRSEMAGEIPAGLEPASAAAAEETIGGAVAAAEHGPPELAEAILSRAFAAYAQGFNTAALIGAAMVLSVAVLAGIALRKVAPSQVSDAHE